MFRRWIATLAAAAGLGLLAGCSDPPKPPAPSAPPPAGKAEAKAPQPKGRAPRAAP